LDEYVQSDDGYFSWEEVASYNYPGATLYILNMTSQRYQTEEFSTQPIWWHWVGVAIPDEIKNLDTSFLVITGGNNENFNPPARADYEGTRIARYASQLGIICAYVKMVPNQPMRFYNDPNFQSRSEDDFIAWTWRTLLNQLESEDEEPNLTIAARMPMTKAVKRAMDAVTAAAKWRIPESNVQKFIVYGESKRGWTVMSIGTTDRRIVAVMPLVFSLINMDVAVDYHFRSMDGAWSFALGPYHHVNLTQDFINPAIQNLWHIEDMYTYKERFTMPFYAISSTGDEIFLPTDNHAWWNDFPDNKHLMMMPNAEHGMAPWSEKIYETSVSWLTDFLEGRPFPKVSWTMGETEGGGWIRMVTDPPPEFVLAWTAVTIENGRKDFRLVGGTGVQRIRWFSDQLEVVDEGDGVYYVETEDVPGFWRGFLLEGTWVGPTGLRYIFTTQVNIIPYTFPHESCYDPASCWGALV